MLYIKHTKDYLEYFNENCEFPDFLKRIIYIYKKVFGKITKIKRDNGEVWLVPENNLKFKNSIIKNLKIYQVRTLVLSNNLNNLIAELKENNINVLNGKWLYKYLLLNIVKFVVENKEENLTGQTIAFAVKNPEEADFENLKILSQDCKSVNLISKDEYKFKRLEQKLYEEQGIVINNSYNYKKSFLKSDIIINIDLDEKEFNKFALPRKSIVINLQDVKIYNKGFNGINILKYEIEFPKAYIDTILNTNHFNKEILYESYLYKRTAPKNILKEIEKDKVKLTHLYGKNGCIDKREYLKV